MNIMLREAIPEKSSVKPLINKIKPVAMNHKIFLYLAFFILINMSTAIFMDSQLSAEAVSDTSETQASHNIISVTQKGSGNSVSISQSGSNFKTKATVKSSGEKNTTEIRSVSDTLQTNVTFLGKSNRLVTQPGPWMQSFSIKASSTPVTGQNFNFIKFYFILNNPEESLHIHQTSDGIKINKKKK